jgi:hypothetical protein
MNHDSVTEKAGIGVVCVGRSQHEARAFDAHLREGCQICVAELACLKVVGVLGRKQRRLHPPYVRDLLAVRIERRHLKPPWRRRRYFSS